MIFVGKQVLTCRSDTRLSKKRSLSLFVKQSRMKSLMLIPAKKISDYVQDILVIENSHVTTPFVLPLYANGSPTLLFQTAKGEINNTSNHLTLFGQTVFPETLTIKEKFTLIAYFFKPFALNALFGVSAQELTDNPINLNLLAPLVTRQLQEQLLSASSLHEMMKILDNYIFALVTKVKTESRLIQFSTLKIAENPSKETLLYVQRELFLTERTFQRMFEKTIGVPPNQYRRICQFNAGFRQLQRRKFNKLSDIAFENAYADQSHYIRSFREFTGITPKDYLNFGNPS
jgi:AraC-like DNA-binding protein